MMNPRPSPQSPPDRNCAPQGLPRALLAVAILAISAGCASTGDSTSSTKAWMPRFYVEASRQEAAGNKTLRVRLPVSESQIAVKPVPVIPEFEIARASVGQGPAGPFLVFDLKPEGRLRLMQISAEYRGWRLILALGGNAIGSWRIDTILSDGRISTFVELPDAELVKAADRINHSLAHVR